MNKNPCYYDMMILHLFIFCYYCCYNYFKVSHIIWYLAACFSHHVEAVNGLELFYIMEGGLIQWFAGFGSWGENWTSGRQNREPAVPGTCCSLFD